MKILLLVALGCSSATGASRPNVIVIMADDIGAEGPGCHGSQICTTSKYESQRQRLQRILDGFMAITDEDGGATESSTAGEHFTEGKK
jgi:hypothetical protein